MQEYDDQERALTAALRQIAAIDAVAAGASPEVRARLLADVRAVARERRRALMKTYALAAGLLVATALPVWQLTTRTPADLSTRTAAGGSGEVATGFYPLTYSAIPVTQGSVVRLAVSPAAFVALGVEPVEWAGPQPDLVLADVFVGEDGLARAVRFVRTIAPAN